MKHTKKSLQWFKDRIGKKVFRTISFCKCEICKNVFEKGVVILDNDHAQYLFDCQNEFDLYYFDKKQ